MVPFWNVLPFVSSVAWFSQPFLIMDRVGKLGTHCSFLPFFLLILSFEEECVRVRARLLVLVPTHIRYWLWFTSIFPSKLWHAQLWVCIGAQFTLIPHCFHKLSSNNWYTQKCYDHKESIDPLGQTLVLVSTTCSSTPTKSHRGFIYCVSQVTTESWFQGECKA